MTRSSRNAPTVSEGIQDARECVTLDPSLYILSLALWVKAKAKAIADQENYFSVCRWEDEAIKEADWSAPLVRYDWTDFVEDALGEID